MADRLGCIARRRTVAKSTDGMGQLVRLNLSLTHNTEVKYFTHTRADYMQGTRMPFSSKEDAIQFAEKHGDGHPNLTFGG